VIVTSIQKLQLHLQQIFIMRMQNSTTICQYKYLRTHINKPLYFNLNAHWSIIKLILQLRSNLPGIRVNAKTTMFNEMTFLLNNRKDRRCRWCENDKAEDLFHVLFVCKLYTYIRQKHLSRYPFPKNCSCAYQFFSDLDLEKATNIYIFMSQVSKIRELWNED
jgi:hypothetical protein